MDFIELKKNLKKDFSNFKKLRVAILADTASQLLTQAIRGWGYEYHLDLQIFEAPFNQIDNQILNDLSELYTNAPEVVIIFQSSQMFLAGFNNLSIPEKELFADKSAEHVDAIVHRLSEKLSPKIIYLNLAETDDSVFGSFGNKVKSSFIYQQRKFNVYLMDLALNNPNLFICDLSTVQNYLGRQALFSPAMFFQNAMPFAINYLPDVASRIVQNIAALYGFGRKCLILDLDNTLWGGVAGDDGLEHIQIGSLGIGKAFTAFQHWIKSLQQRGVLLAVCSKGDEAIAKEPFEKHPDMVLRLNDISVFIANWESKVDNIIAIQAALNIGFDSMVFIDDSRFERNLVRQHLKEVYVPEMPQDPADYLSFLYSLNLFETAFFSREDTTRTTFYQSNAKRAFLNRSLTNENDYLKSLNMASHVEPFNNFNAPRVAQLSQRTNQFNLRTVRLTETDVSRIANDSSYYTFTFTLRDIFGTDGLVCVIILQKENESVLFVESWFMSCRVLKRTLEGFVLNEVVQFAIDKGFQYLKAEYIPNMKNGIVKDLYKDLGFAYNNEYWILDLNSYRWQTSYIAVDDKHSSGP